MILNIDFIFKIESDVLKSFSLGAFLFEFTYTKLSVLKPVQYYETYSKYLPHNYLLKRTFESTFLQSAVERLSSV